MDGQGPYDGIGHLAGDPLLRTDRPALRPAVVEFGNEIDLKATLLTLWLGKWSILLAMLIAGALALAVVAQRMPVYRATAKVMFDVPHANLEAGEALVTTTAGGTSVQNRIEVLRSEKLMLRVVDDLGLRAPLSEAAPFRPWMALPEPWLRWAEALGLIRRSAPLPAGGESGADRDRDTLVQDLLAGLDLAPVKGSDVIVIGYSAPDPVTAARVANTIAEQYIVDQLAGKLETFDAATLWLSDRVQELQARVEANENAVLQAHADLAEAAGASLETTRKQLAALTGALAQARQRTARLQAGHRRLSEAMATGVDLASLSELRANTVVAALREREAELLTEDRALAKTLREGHTARQRVSDELTSVRAAIQAEAENILAAMRLDLEAAHTLEAQLTADLRRVEDQALTLSSQSVEIRNLEREAQASRILYENLLSRLQETSAQQDLQSTDARILTSAKPPAEPVATARNRLIAGALILGAIIGGALVLMFDRFNATFRSGRQIEEVLDQPVLATVPRLRRRAHRRDLVRHLRETPNSALAESIRNLRTSILFAGEGRAPRVVLFSSAVPGEGKTTTAMLTALTSQQMGKATVIVDCDLRKPSLSRFVPGSRTKPGLMSVIDGRASLDDALYCEPETGLDVLTVPPAECRDEINAADVLASPRFREVIGALAGRYDLVVLDTPPTLVVTDARVLSSLADAVVFAVRWAETPRGAVAEGLRELTSVRAPVIGCALTQIDEQRAARLADAGYGYYKGRYRDYYEA